MWRLEAHLIGGTTLLDCKLKAQAMDRQKKGTMRRALGTPKLRLNTPRRKK